MKVIVVGGVAGGASAAARIRRLDEAADVVVYERSGYISYANCGLPYYIGGAITDPAQLTLQTPESFWRRFRIRMKVHHEVLAIHPQRKAVTVRNLATGAVFEDTYDKPLLSPGRPPRAAQPSGHGGQAAVHAAHCGGYLPNSHVHPAAQPAFCRAGRRWLHWAGAGRKPAPARAGGNACRADAPGVGALG